MEHKCDKEREIDRIYIKVDSMDKKMDDLLQWKWKITGASLLIALIISVFVKVYAFEDTRIFQKSGVTATVTAYLDVLKAKEASIQADFDTATTGTFFFYVSNDSLHGPINSARWVELTSDRWTTASTGSSSFVKTFSSLPYKSLKIEFNPSTGTTTFSTDFLIK